MNKKLASIIVFAGLFCVASTALAVEVPNFLGSTTFKDLLLKIAGGVGEVVAALGTIMVIWAGILYLTSAGNPQKIQTAKSAITYAIIGITIGIAAKAIVEIIQNIIGA